MKQLLGMAKEKRKNQPQPKKPFGKINIQPQQQQFYNSEIQEDQDYEPDDQQIFSYASYLGIKLPEEQDLLYIAREGLMADLPADWVNEETETGDIVYINIRTGQRTLEHPCDEYFRQLVTKERRKRNSQLKNHQMQSKISQLGNLHGSTPIAAQQKNIDPLVKMQMQKKQKRLEEQKKKEFEEKKKEIVEKYELKREKLEHDLKSKEKRLREKLQEQQQEEKNKHLKKMSEQEKEEEEKNQTILDKYEKEIRMKIEKNIHERKVSQTNKIERKFKGKKQEARINLQGQLKQQKKQLEDQYRERMKILAEKQKNILNQKSDDQIMQEQISKLKSQILEKRLKQYENILQKERQQQISSYKQKVLNLQKQYEEKTRDLEKSEPKKTIKTDKIVEQIQEKQKEEIKVFQYELMMIREMKKVENDDKLQQYKQKLLESKKEDISSLERQFGNMFEKFKRTKQEYYANKVAQAEKKAKQDYLLSLKSLQDKYHQQQEIIQLENYKNKSGNQSNFEVQGIEMMEKVLKNLNWKENLVRQQIQALREQIQKIQSNTKPIIYKLDGNQEKIYNLLREKIAKQI